MPAPPVAAAVPGTAAADGTVDGTDVTAGGTDTRTGHPAVDAAIEAVRNATGLPPADQIAQYEAAHGTLQEALATIDQA
ncbi:hypothetical protein EDC02_1514 [Micromonospora sp. Llam0]|uniref:hypothetical protein n=1 Tax=Micromonospora sp. Llam0 TaxID=2485143 RepID=UPI000FBFE79E|nr:hypothetical protein [Micromonospora sp. Llam0]ROO59703.1 hypothetical protein EDC02_1514 [Micromonospora sp. Llam0]